MKKSLWALAIIMVVFIVQIVLHNKDYFGPHSPSEKLDSNAAVLKDLVYEGGSYRSLSNDSWVEYLSVGKQVDTLKLTISYEDNNNLLQVFYTTNKGEGYSEEKSQVYTTNSGTHDYFVHLKEKRIENIRIDGTNLNNSQFQLIDTTINPIVKFSFNTIILVESLLISGALFLSYLIVLKREFIIRNRYQIGIIIFSILVLFKLHGSSIGIWDNFIPAKADSCCKTTLLGQERSIRSDEFLVQTPYMLSQVKGGFAIDNDNIRSDGQNMALANAPTLTLDTLGKPVYYGFLLFGKDYGLSWFWYSKLLLLLLFSFELSMFLTRNNKLLSSIGAVWIAFAPPIQWWYTTGAGVVELIVYSQGMIVAVLYYFKATNRMKKWLLVLMFTFFSMGFCFTFYPAVQVPLGVLTLIFLIGIIMQNKKMLAALTRLDYIVFLCAALLLLLSGFTFYLHSKETLNILLNTSYPGKRLSTGGTYPFSDLQLYLVSWLLPYKDVSFSNSSTASSFYNFFPLIILTFPMINKKLVVNRKVIISLLIYMLFQLSWLFIHYPEFFAKVSLFSFVPETRLGGITFGLSAAYLSIWFVSEVIESKLFSHRSSLFYCFMVAILFYYSVFHTEMKDYLGHWSVVVVIIFVAINFMLLKGYKYAFLTSMLLIILISGITVNPIARGTDAIYNKKIAKIIQNINITDPNKKWMAVDSLVNGQYLIALGVNSFNSVHFYPDLKTWEKFDPENKYKEIYNRYAHVKVSLINTGPSYFELNQPDSFTFKLNINEIKKTGTTFILSTTNLSQYLQLKELNHDIEDNLYIYKVS